MADRPKPKIPAQSGPSLLDIAKAKAMRALVGEERRKAHRKAPSGLGGYRMRRVGTVLLDPRQKEGVPVFYAELIERNHYR